MPRMKTFDSMNAAYVREAAKASRAACTLREANRRMARLAWQVAPWIGATAEQDARYRAEIMGLIEFCGNGPEHDSLCTLRDELNHIRAQIERGVSSPYVRP